MKADRIGALLLLALILSGCTRLALMGSDDPLADMRAAREAGDFERALYFAENLDPEHPQYPSVQQELPALQSAIREFELRNIRKAEAAAAREDWAEADETLRQAMSEWRRSDSLVDARDNIREAEAQRRREVHGNLLLSEARWRSAHSSLAEQLQPLTDRASERRLRHWRDRSEEVAGELARLAEYFAEQDDWDRVRDYLASARALVPGSGRTDLLDKARRELAEAAREYQSRRHRKQLGEARELLKRYQSTARLQDLLAVRNFLQLHKENEQLQNMAETVARLARERFQQDLKKGEALYANGEYHQAYEIWKNIAPLSPDDPELKKKLERAEKVLSKLKSLGRE